MKTLRRKKNPAKWLVFLNPPISDCDWDAVWAPSFSSSRARSKIFKICLFLVTTTIRTFEKKNSWPFRSSYFKFITSKHSHVVQQSNRFIAPTWFFLMKKQHHHVFTGGIYHKSKKKVAKHYLLCQTSWATLLSS